MVSLVIFFISFTAFVVGLGVYCCMVCLFVGIIR